MTTLAVSLFAQTESIFSNIYVYVSPAVGGTTEERDFFDFNLQEEVMGGGYTLTNDLYADPGEAWSQSDFYIDVELSYDQEYDEHIVTLILYNTLTGAELVTSGMVYETLDEMYKWNLTLIYQVMANAPISHLTDEELTKKSPGYWLHLGFRAGPSMRLYSPMSYAATMGIGVDIGVQLMVQPLPFLGIQLETLFTIDYAPMLGINDNNVNAVNDSITSFGLMIPLLVKGTFQVSNMFRIDPFAGIYFWTPMGNASIKEVKESENTVDGPSKISPAPFGVTGGFSLGISIGPGSLLIDTRYSYDFGDTIINEKPVYRRSMVTLSIGYEFNFLEKTPKAQVQSAANQRRAGR